MSDTEKFSISPDLLPSYLYEWARKLMSVAEQVQVSQSALDLIAALPDPELPLSSLDTAQKAVVARFLIEILPDADLAQYELQAP